MANPPTAVRVRELFDYDQETGVFSRRVASGGQPAGAIKLTPDSLGYLKLRVDGKSYKAHRLAWLYVYGNWPEGHLDHKDGQPDNNAICNLRLATRSQNKANSRRYATNSSGYKGVRFYTPNGKWLARISHQGTRIHLGYFDSAERAYQAYLAAAQELFGEFARAA